MVRRSAASADSEKGASEVFLVFRVGVQKLGFPLGDVQEIRPWQGVTRVPRAPASVLGIVSLRGSVITVCDVRRALGTDDAQPTKKTRLLLVRTAREQMGFLVDEVLQVVRFPREDIERDVGVDFPLAILGVGRTRLSHRFGTHRRDVALREEMEMVVLMNPNTIAEALTKDGTS